MASHHGTSAEFSGIAEDWEAYMEQLESYFVANDITTAAKKRAVLLSSCGTATYKIIRSVVAPEKPSEVLYSDLTKKVREHFRLSLRDPLFHGTDRTKLRHSPKRTGQIRCHVRCSIPSHYSGNSGNTFSLTSNSNYITEALHNTHTTAKNSIHCLCIVTWVRRLTETCGKSA